MKGFVTISLLLATLMSSCHALPWQNFESSTVSKRDDAVPQVSSTLWVGVPSIGDINTTNEAYFSVLASIIDCNPAVVPTLFGGVAGQNFSINATTLPPTRTSFSSVDVLVHVIAQNITGTVPNRGSGYVTGVGLAKVTVSVPLSDGSIAGAPNGTPLWPRILLYAINQAWGIASGDYKTGKEVMVNGTPSSLAALYMTAISGYLSITRTYSKAPEIALQEQLAMWDDVQNPSMPKVFGTSPNATYNPNRFITLNSTQYLNNDDFYSNLYDMNDYSLPNQLVPAPLAVKSLNLANMFNSAAYVVMPDPGEFDGPANTYKTIPLVMNGQLVDGGMPIGI